MGRPGHPGPPDVHLAADGEQYARLGMHMARRLVYGRSGDDSVRACHIQRCLQSVADCATGANAPACASRNLAELYPFYSLSGTLPDSLGNLTSLQYLCAGLPCCAPSSERRDRTAKMKGLCVKKHDALCADTRQLHVR